jgi:hypothetical protein
MTQDIPSEVLDGIRRAAKTDWPGDREMQQHVIDSETEAYHALQVLDFGEALPFKQAILDEASQYNETWEDRFNAVQGEVEAFAELAALSPDDVPADMLAGMKQRAAVEHDWYSAQLEEVQQGIEGYRYVQRTRAKVGPIRDILVRMESIIGSECYNANIQNYSAWGVWEGEGRSFRYPVTYIRDGQEEKRKARVDDLQPEALITGHYKFGANELSIYRALVRIVDMLEADYGLKIARAGEEC